MRKPITVLIITGALYIFYILNQTQTTPLEDSLPWDRSDFNCPDCNIILISVDTLRSDHIGAYGYGKNTTPFIDSISKGGVLFKNTYAPAPWTLPSHVSIFTGAWPFTHGVVHSDSKFNGDLPTIASTLEKYNYSTAGFAGGAFLSPDFGVDYGFETYDSKRQIFNATDGTSMGNTPFRKAISWINSTNGKKFFLFIHTYRVHDYANFGDITAEDLPQDGSGWDFKTPNGRFSFSSEYGWTNLTDNESDQLRLLEESYDSSILYVDRLVQNLFTALSQKGLLNKTFVVITSDHGEEFGEHLHTSHGNTLYEEVLRVPLIIIPPRTNHPGETVEEPVSTVDIYSTAMAILGLNETSPDGKSLIPESLGIKPKERRELFANVDYFVNKDAVMSNGMKLIHTTRERVSEPQTQLLDGFYTIENSGNVTYRWTKNNSSIGLSDFAGTDGILAISLGVPRWRPTAYNLSFSLDGNSLGYTETKGYEQDIFTVNFPSRQLAKGNGRLHMDSEPWTPDTDNRVFGIPVDWINITLLNESDRTQTLKATSVNFASTEEADTYEYYNLTLDPLEKRDVFTNSTDPIGLEKKMEVLSEIDGIAKHENAKIDETKELRDELKALGYM